MAGVQRKEVIIEIDEETGEIKIDAVGYAGKECLKDVDWISNSLGVTISDKVKPEANRLASAGATLGRKAVQ